MKAFLWPLIILLLTQSAYPTGKEVDSSQQVADLLLGILPQDTKATTVIKDIAVKMSSNPSGSEEYKKEIVATAEAFAKRLWESPAMRDELTHSLNTNFSGSELMDLLHFLRTSAGKKIAPLIGYYRNQAYDSYVIVYKRHQSELDQELDKVKVRYSILRPSILPEPDFGKDKSSDNSFTLLYHYRGTIHSTNRLPCLIANHPMTRKQ
jgi:hypothetical protein